MWALSYRTVKSFSKIQVNSERIIGLNEKNHYLGFANYRTQWRSIFEHPARS